MKNECRPVNFTFDARTRLTVSAWGGPNGGTLNLTSQNLDKLVPVACGPLVLPPSVMLAPYQEWSVSYLCEGERASTAENDIVVEGVLSETGTDLNVSSRIELTSVKIELIPPDEYFIHLWKYEPYASALQPSHNGRAGAGIWYDVKTGNIMGGSAAWDRAGVGGAFPRMTSDGTPTTDSTCGWLGGGSLTWKGPFGWGPKDHREDADPIQCFAEDTRQVFNLSANGDFGMMKLGHVAERKIDGTVRLYNSPGTGGVGN